MCRICICMKICDSFSSYSQKHFLNYSSLNLIVILISLISPIAKWIKVLIFPDLFYLSFLNISQSISPNIKKCPLLKSCLKIFLIPAWRNLGISVGSRLTSGKNFLHIHTNILTESCRNTIYMCIYMYKRTRMVKSLQQSLIEWATVT